MAWDYKKEQDLIEAAAGIIANVGSRNGQGWDNQHDEWQDAAMEWMQGYGAFARAKRRELGKKP